MIYGNRERDNVQRERRMEVGRLLVCLFIVQKCFLRMKEKREEKCRGKK